MYELKIVTTVLIAFMMLTVLAFCKGAKCQKDKAMLIGFGCMEGVYALSLICMWV